MQEWEEGGALCGIVSFWRRSCMQQFSLASVWNAYVSSVWTAPEMDYFFLLIAEPLKRCDRAERGLTGVPDIY